MAEDPQEQPAAGASSEDAAVAGAADDGAVHSADSDYSAFHADAGTSGTGTSRSDTSDTDTSCSDTSGSDTDSSGTHACDCGTCDGDGSARDAAACSDDDAHNAALDAMTELLREQARGWGRQIRQLLQLDALTERGAAAGRGRLGQLEMAGSWNVSQLTATRWQDEARWFDQALPRTLAMLETGALLVHQALVLLHRTRCCTVEVARAVEEQVLPAGAGLCPADLTRRVMRAVLRVEAELDAAAAEQRRADAAASRRTFTRPEPDGMGLAGAVLTAQQLVAWQGALDALERRERAADRAGGVVRTVAQRKADLFAALPAMVLAGTAQDRAVLTDLARAGLPVPGVSAPFSTGRYNTGPFSIGPFSTAPAPGPTAAGVGGVRGAGFGSGAAASAATGSAPVASTDLVAAAAAVLAQAGGTDGAAPPDSSGGPATDGAADAGPSDGPAGCPPLVPWTCGPEQLAAHVVLHVHVPVATVLDLSREPGTMSGYGPVSAEHIRLLRPRSWRRVLADSRTGRPIAVDDRLTPADPDPHTAREQVRAMLRPQVVVDTDEPQHDPSARLARLVDLRDVHCCGPGCSSTLTDRDHLEPWPCGPTSADNLTRLSRRCHRAKHHGWHLQRHDDGSVTWTSPLRRTYTRPSPHHPPPHVDLNADLPPLRPRDRAAARLDTPRWLTPHDLAAPEQTARAEAQATGASPSDRGATPADPAFDADADQDEAPPF